MAMSEAAKRLMDELKERGIEATYNEEKDLVYTKDKVIKPIIVDAMNIPDKWQLVWRGIEGKGFKARLINSARKLAYKFGDYVKYSAINTEMNEKVINEFKKAGIPCNQEYFETIIEESSILANAPHCSVCKEIVSTWDKEFYAKVKQELNESLEQDQRFYRSKVAKKMLLDLISTNLHQIPSDVPISLTVLFTIALYVGAVDIEGNEKDFVYKLNFRRYYDYVKKCTTRGKKDKAFAKEFIDLADKYFNNDKKANYNIEGMFRAMHIGGRFYIHFLQITD